MAVKWPSPWWRAIPVLNVFVDSIFSHVPTAEQIQSMASLLGLISALVTSSILTMVTAVTYDDLKAADDRLLDGPYREYTEATLQGIRPSTEFFNCGNVAVILNCITIVSSTVLYLMASNLPGSKEIPVHAGWYRWVRWAIAVQLGCFLASIVYVARAFRALNFIKAPDYSFEGAGGAGGTDFRNPWPSTFTTNIACGVVVFPVTLAVVALLYSVATWERHRPAAGAAGDRDGGGLRDHAQSELQVPGDDQGDNKGPKVAPIDIDDKQA